MDIICGWRHLLDVPIVCLGNRKHTFVQLLHCMDYLGGSIGMPCLPWTKPYLYSGREWMV